MAKIFGQEYSKKEILKRVGSLSQICGTKLYEFADGPAKGIRAVDFSTGGGLNFTALVDRGLDISSASYNGMGLVWRSATQEVHGAFYDPRGNGWLKTFFGGLLTTCGLTTAGASSTDEGTDLGQHGCYTVTPASLLSLEGNWEGDEYYMEIRGQIEEVAVFGHKLRLTRTISAYLGADSLSIHDSIENIGSKKSPLMLLYHIGAGFPIVSDSSKLISTAVEATPLDEGSRKRKKHYNIFTEPQADIDEECYSQVMKTDDRGNAYSAIVNENLNDGFGLYVKYQTENLPWMIGWKMMGEGEYVVGMEPGNCLIGGRASERANGTLREIAPGEIVETNIEIGVLPSQREINSYTELVEKILDGQKLVMK